MYLLPGTYGTLYLLQELGLGGGSLYGPEDKVQHLNNSNFQVSSKLFRSYLIINILLFYLDDNLRHVQPYRRMDMNLIFQRLFDVEDVVTMQRLRNLLYC
jgi:hypothetical protein